MEPMRRIELSRQRLDAFFNRLAAAPTRALLLDYDGTLAPFRARRDLAVPHPGLPEVLSALQAAGHTRIVVVSSRYSEDLLPLLAMEHPPEIWGSHGWERRFPDGRTEIGHMDPAALQGLAEADDWVETAGLSPLSEQKPGCLALHLRGLPKNEAPSLRSEVLDAWRELAWRRPGTGREVSGGRVRPWRRTRRRAHRWISSGQLARRVFPGSGRREDGDLHDHQRHACDDQRYRRADAAFLAAFVNVSAVVAKLLEWDRIHIICAGTDRRVGEDDVLLAGMLVERLQRQAGSTYELNAQAATAREFWLHSFALPQSIGAETLEPERLVGAIAEDPGGEEPDCPRAGRRYRGPRLRSTGSHWCRSSIPRRFGSEMRAGEGPHG